MGIARSLARCCIVERRRMALKTPNWINDLEGGKKDYKATCSNILPRNVKAFPKKKLAAVFYLDQFCEIKRNAFRLFFRFFLLRSGYLTR